jgi:uncharacterized protein with predicted RNA binding PUA domain
MRPANERETAYLREIAVYQFGREVGEVLLSSPLALYLHRSKRTGRIRYVLDQEKRLYLTLRASDNLFTLTLNAGLNILKNIARPWIAVEVKDEVSPFIEIGKDVFAKHVVHISNDLRPGDEVLVVGSDFRLLGIGKLMLSGAEVLSYKRGIAVRVRRGIKS